MWGKLRTLWDRENSLSAFLWAMLVFVFVVGPLATINQKLLLLIDFTFAIVMLSGIWATIASPQVALTAVGVVILAVASNVINRFLLPGCAASALSTFFDLLALLILLFVSIKQTLKPGRVNSHRIKGAMASYLLLALVWAKVYLLIERTVPGSFSGLGQEETFQSLIYFSFVTLTSVGYGDILPIQVFARSLANAEAVVGQMFLAIFIARLLNFDRD